MKSFKSILIALAILGAGQTAHAMESLKKFAKVAFVASAVASNPTATRNEYALVANNNALLSPINSYDDAFEKCENMLDGHSEQIQDLTKKLKKEQAEYQTKHNDFFHGLVYQLQRILGINARATYGSSGTGLENHINTLTSLGLGYTRSTEPSSSINFGTIYWVTINTKFPQDKAGLKKLRERLFEIYEENPTQENRKKRNAVLALEKELQALEDTHKQSEHLDLYQLEKEHAFAAKWCNGLQNPDKFEETLKAMQAELEQNKASNELIFNQEHQEL